MMTRRARRNVVLPIIVEIRYGTSCFVSVYLRCVLVYEAGAFSLAPSCRSRRGDLQIARSWEDRDCAGGEGSFQNSTSTKVNRAPPIRSNSRKTQKKKKRGGGRDALRNSRSRRTQSRYVTTPTELSRGVRPTVCQEARARARPTSVGLLA
ncbi:hypothetical protein BC826DRAFT_143966 [Russula brevipes]|nr:hypothetical protein BC826DRAFT_143966 [Russula brevipes]